MITATGSLVVRACPLILTGTDDPIVPLVTARRLARMLPNTTRHVYHEAHLGLSVQAHELAPVVTDFLLS